MQHVVAPLLIAVNEGLGVGAGSEPVALALEVGAQFAEVVDLAVETTPTERSSL